MTGVPCPALIVPSLPHRAVPCQTSRQLALLEELEPSGLPAITAVDVGKHVAVKRGVLHIDGRPRAVRWSLPICPQPEDTSGVVIDVDGEVGGEVRLCGDGFSSGQVGGDPYMSSVRDCMACVCIAACEHPLWRPTLPVHSTF